MTVTRRAGMATYEISIPNELIDAAAKNGCSLGEEVERRAKAIGHEKIGALLGRALDEAHQKVIQSTG